MGVVGSKPPHELQEEERRKVMDMKSTFMGRGGTSYSYVKRNLAIRRADPIVPDAPFAVMGDARRTQSRAPPHLRHGRAFARHLQSDALHPQSFHDHGAEGL